MRYFVRLEHLNTFDCLVVDRPQDRFFKVNNRYLLFPDTNMTYGSLIIFDRKPSVDRKRQVNNNYSKNSS